MAVLDVWKSDGHSPTRILIADDLDSNLKTICAVIERSNLDVTVHTATCGSEALAQVLEHDFGLVILDVQMPDMDGFEVAQFIRGRRDSRHVPIIFVTAGATHSYQVFQGYEAGAIDYLCKPFDPEILIGKLRIFIELDQARRRLRAQLSEINRQKEELAQRNDELEKLRKSAEQSSLAKSRFLANMSHEIRTPLGAMLGFADLLESEGLSTADQREYIQTIRRNGHLLLHVINDILDFSKVEAGRMDFEWQDVALDQLLAAVIKDLQAPCDQKNLSLALQVDPEIPSRVVLDSNRVTQILMNIIGNAIKFTSEGGVDVTVKIKPGPERKFIIIAVKDTGRGIARHELPRLFEPFAQADTSMTRKFGGTGLGLVLSRELARAMGGDVVIAASEWGRGSLVEITLPLRPALTGTPAAPQESSQVPITLDGIAVLLVDDSQDNRRLVSHILKRSGAAVDSACDGMEALVKASETHYDVILMDVQMPDMDGCEATRQMRARGLSLPIIALTAHAMAEEKSRFMAAGYTDHLAKPINIRQLLETVRRYGGAASAV